MHREIRESVMIIADESNELAYQDDINRESFSFTNVILTKSSLSSTTNAVLTKRSMVV